MATATLTGKGQMTVPKEIRELLDLHPGDRVELTPDSEGDREPARDRRRAARSSPAGPGGARALPGERRRLRRLLIGALNLGAGCSTTYTFDRDAAELREFNPVPALP